MPKTVYGDPPIEFEWENKKCTGKKGTTYRATISYRNPFTGKITDAQKSWQANDEETLNEYIREKIVPAKHRKCLMSAPSTTHTVSKSYEEYPLIKYCNEHFDEIARNRPWCNAPYSTVYNYEGQLNGKLMHKFVKCLDSDILSKITAASCSAAIDKLLQDYDKTGTTPESQKKKETHEKRVGRLITILRSVFDYAVARGHIDTNPLPKGSDTKTSNLISKLKRERLKSKSLSVEEMRKLIEKIENNYLSNGAYMGIAIMFYMGLRTSEACGLIYDDIVEMKQYPGEYYAKVVRQTRADKIDKDSLWLKSVSGYRLVPLVPEFAEMIKSRRKELETVCEPENIPYCTIASRPNDCMLPCTNKQINDCAKKIYGDIGLKSTLLISPQRILMLDSLESTDEDTTLASYDSADNPDSASEGDTITPYDSSSATESDDEEKPIPLDSEDETDYLLRRNAYTNFLSLASLRQEEAAYLIGHSLKDITTGEIDRPYQDFTSEEAQHRMLVKLKKITQWLKEAPEGILYELTPDKPISFNDECHIKLHVNVASASRLLLNVNSLEPNQKYNITIKANNASLIRTVNAVKPTIMHSMPVANIQGLLFADRVNYTESSDSENAVSVHDYVRDLHEENASVKRLLNSYDDEFPDYSEFTDFQLIDDEDDIEMLDALSLQYDNPYSEEDDWYEDEGNIDDSPYEISPYDLLPLESKKAKSLPFPEESSSIIIATRDGYILRLATNQFKTVKAHSQGRKAIKSVSECVTSVAAVTADDDFVLLFSQDGKAFIRESKVFPIGTTNTKGIHISKLSDPIGVSAPTVLSCIVVIPASIVRSSNESQPHYVLLTLSNGKVKRMKLEILLKSLATSNQVINLKDMNAYITSATITDGNCDIILMTDSGHALCFPEKLVSARRPSSKWTCGIKIDDESFCISCISIPEKSDGNVISISREGCGKASSITGFYRKANRSTPCNPGGKGRFYYRITEKSGKVTPSIFVVSEMHHLFILSTRGNLVRIAVEEFPNVGMRTTGNIMVRLDGTVACTCVLPVTTERSDE